MIFKKNLVTKRLQIMQLITARKKIICEKWYGQILAAVKNSLRFLNSFLPPFPTQYRLSTLPRIYLPNAIIVFLLLVAVRFSQIKFSLIAPYLFVKNKKNINLFSISVSFFFAAARTTTHNFRSLNLGVFFSECKRRINFWNVLLH